MARLSLMVAISAFYGNGACQSSDIGAFERVFRGAAARLWL